MSWGNFTLETHKIYFGLILMSTAFANDDNYCFFEL